MKVVAKVLVFDSSGNVLVLIRNATHPHFPNQFDLPGGEVEQDESEDQASVRELQEETGLIIPEKNLRLVYKKQISDRLLHVIYETALLHPKHEIQLSWEHAESAWLSLKDLELKPTTEATDEYYLTVIEYLQQRNSSRHKIHE